ncbi:hypothetical protein Mbo2_004 [Rhodococcus phage Mbo2]|uniref:Uncharacterized protein n=1 Tax=Rhodococcus phage Mbo2 TaxID=2936911 RepID=A0A9E7IEB6_9CAUD|nr:hypothetical protein Mbo2_004 [Rhodococcus phage Mbo2]
MLKTVIVIGRLGFGSSLLLCRCRGRFFNSFLRSGYPVRHNFSECVAETTRYGSLWNCSTRHPSR